MQWLVGVLVAWAINVLALVVADWAFDGLEIERWGPVIFAGAVLGLANAFLRPIVRIVALPLIVLTLGIAYLFVNTLMLLVTEWISPDLTIDGFWTYVGATIVVGLVNWLASAASASALRGR
jgi:putative membrane protein